MHELYIAPPTRHIPVYEGSGLHPKLGRRMERIAVTAAARIRRLYGTTPTHWHTNDIWNTIWDLFPSMGPLMQRSMRYRDLVVNRTIAEVTKINEEYWDEHGVK